MDIHVEIKKYIKRALENKNFYINEIKINESGEASGGYASDITFATVLATTEENIERSIEIVVKYGKKDFSSSGNIYQREAYFYKSILPEFTRFQQQNNIKNIFDSIPKCYETISDESVEVIVMENLKKSGYDLYDRKKPLDLNHLKLVLREYGKFHAISFALRDKCKDSFEKLTRDFDDVVLEFFDASFQKTMQQCLERACDIVRTLGHTKLYEICNKILQRGAGIAVIEILKTVEPDSAILHGDCWNNNLLFKYENEDCRIPSKVAIIDWQISRLHSPALDLSFFIYSTCSEEQLRHFDELLDTYYTSFSAFLRELGCYPEKLFSYSTLRRHWKQYSLQGMLLVTSFLHVTMCDKEEAAEFSNTGDLGEKIMNVNITDEAEYRKRLVAVISHYCNYNQE